VSVVNASHVSARRTLVAGIGNIFLGDDGFGLEVIRRLSTMPVPEGVTVADFGNRGIHLAYEILDGYDRVVLVDALAHGGAPGAIALFEVDSDRFGEDAAPDSHDMHPAAVLAFVRSIGGTSPPVIVVGCEPACLGEGIGLSAAVEASIDEAVRAVLELVQDEGMTGVPSDSGTDSRAIR
jgi:hydrogenase maturation protease